jgi:RNA polymerase sigma factor (sigma-70 family)
VSPHPDPTASTVQRTVEAVWRLEAGRIIGGLARMIGDIGLAEEFAQDAVVAALEQWPRDGVPPNPGAWLMLTAKRRAIDRVRRRERLQQKAADLADIEQQRRLAEEATPEPDDIDDDLLRLIFIACHPVLSVEARVALTLKTVAGLTVEQIAAGLLAAPATIAQRIVRAKRTLAARSIPFELPEPDERAERLSSVLEVIYLIFNEGYVASSGPEWMRPELCREAVRLARILAHVAPRETEVHGLVALLELQHSRAAARVDEHGTPIPLFNQNRGRWDQLLIRRGFAALLRAGHSPGGPGPYVLQAAIAACHAQARTAADTDWVQIAALYQALLHVHPSPIVQLNQAVAVSMAYGPGAGLEQLDALADEPALKASHLLPSVRGDLLARLGRHAEASTEFARAAELTDNQRVRAVTLARAHAAARAAAAARPSAAPAQADDSDAHHHLSPPRPGG